MRQFVAIAVLFLCASVAEAQSELQPELLVFTMPGCQMCDQFKADFGNRQESVVRSLQSPRPLKVRFVSTTDADAPEEFQRYDVDRVPAFVLRDPVSGASVASSDPGYFGITWLKGHVKSGLESLRTEIDAQRQKQASKRLPSSTITSDLEQGSSLTSRGRQIVLDEINTVKSDIERLKKRLSDLEKLLQGR
jgi:hypothetical protein